MYYYEETPLKPAVAYLIRAFLCTTKIPIFLRACGTFIREGLAKHTLDEWELTLNPGHATVHEIPAEYSAVSRFGLIRNPWDWYVSLYSGWRVVSAREPSALRGRILEEVVAVSSDSDFRTIIGNLLRIPQLEKDDIGPMTWVYTNMYGVTPATLEENPENLTIKKFEGIRENVIDMLAPAGVPMQQAL
jgi:hypothetical protein